MWANWTKKRLKRDSGTVPGHPPGPLAGAMDQSRMVLTAPMPNLQSSIGKRVGHPHAVRAAPCPSAFGTAGRTGSVKGGHNATMRSIAR